MTLRKALYIFLLIALFLGIGILREYLFIHINFVLSGAQPNKYYTFPAELTFLQNIPKQYLLKGKYLLTFLFIGIYTLLSGWGIWIFFKNKPFVKITTAIFMLLFMISLLAYLTGIVTGFPEKGYATSRLIAGILQSPIILMVLIPSFLIYQQKND